MSLEKDSRGGPGLPPRLNSVRPAGRVPAISLVLERNRTNAFPVRGGAANGKCRRKCTNTKWWPARGESTPPRTYEPKNVMFYPLNRRALRRRKTKTLTHSTPLRRWLVPRGWEELMHRVPGRLRAKGKKGNREGLQLIRPFAMAAVAGVYRHSPFGLRRTRSSPAGADSAAAAPQRREKRAVGNGPHPPLAPGAAAAAPGCRSLRATGGEGKGPRFFPYTIIKRKTFRPPPTSATTTSTPSSPRPRGRSTHPICLGGLKLHCRSRNAAPPTGGQRGAEG